MTQKEKVFEICREICPARTSQIAIEALKQGIGANSSTRYLRWLQEEGKVISYCREGDSEKTWEVVEKNGELF